VNYLKTLVAKSATASNDSAVPYPTGGRATTIGSLNNGRLGRIDFSWREILSYKIRLPKPPSQTTAQTRFRVKPAGWFLIFLLIWLPLAAVVTVNNFLWLVFTMLIGIAVASHILAKKNLASVTFVRRFPDEVYAGTSFSVRYVARSDLKPWGSFGFTLRESGDLKAEQETAHFPQVAPDRPTEVTAYYVADSRGEVQVDPAVLSSTFPFGLAEYSRTSGQAETVLVFPRLVPVEDEIRSWLGGTGRGVERADPFGVVPFLFRDYVPGDRYKHIDWKKTARSGSLITKILSDEGAREIAIRLPAGASETAISRAASLAVHFLRMGRSVSLEAPGLSVEPGRGRDFTRHVLTVLARWKGAAPGAAVVKTADVVAVTIDRSDEFRWE
jgi:uncharacterized protein (DUF58 family)